ncbi:hypothetical protein [Dyadobacter beijingensis]|uniref:hypothetical protein n=1 Tax=Dyadobacter beijingensis TaxID=365489 RepID=UPI00039E8568|nr:hypothetical protein [Dyadobacter beijingensis]
MENDREIMEKRKLIVFGLGILALVSSILFTSCKASQEDDRTSNSSGLLSVDVNL